MDGQAGTFHHHGYKILSNVMKISFNRADDHSSPGRGLFVTQKGFKNFNSFTHYFGSHKHFRNEHILILHFFANNIHSRYQPFIKDVRGRDTFSQCVIHQL